MLRSLAIFISAIAVLLSSCATTDGNVLASGSRRAEIVEALSSENTEDSGIDLALELPFADTVRNTPQPQPAAEEPVSSEIVEEESIPEDVPEAVAEAEESIEPQPSAIEDEDIISEEEPAEEKAAEQDVPVGPMPAEEVQEQDVPAAEEIPEAVSEPAAIETTESAALDEEIPAAEESVPYAVHQTTFSHAAVPATMNRLIIDAMIASVVIVIMFTVATAIRSAYKMPLSYLLSAVIAILISFLPFLICIIIGGMSKVWFSYFVLLLSFFIFRSGKGRRDFR